MIFQICNDFNYQQLYSLIFNQNQTQIDQAVYCPDTNPALHQKKAQNLNPEIQFFNPLLKRKLLFRLNYFYKILFIAMDLKRKISVDHLDLFHAHTLFSDGGVAWLLSKIYRKPYVVTVRHTDINIFLKYKPYLKPFGKLILKSSSAIVFPSPVLREKSILQLGVDREDPRLYVIPNPLNNFWLENLHLEPKIFSSQQTFKLLFVGKVDANKNLVPLIYALDQLIKRFPVELQIVGEIQLPKVEKIIASRSWIKHLGYIKDLETLSQKYRKAHLLCLPSKHETFGMVCLEGLSQGLPFLMRANEGLESLVENGSYKFSFQRDQDLTEVLEDIIINYPAPKERLSSQFFEDFTLESISDQYLNIYSKLK